MFDFIDKFLGADTSGVGMFFFGVLMLLFVMVLVCWWFESEF